MAGLGLTYGECFFANRSDHTAKASFTAEASLLAGTNEQPVIPARYWEGPKGFARPLTILARGIVASTGTPTYTFTCRLGTTAGSASLTGTAVGVSAAITTASGVTDKYWELRLDVTCNTPGIGTNNATLNCTGYVRSPGGFAAPYEYALSPGGGETGTWTATLDGNLDQYFNLSITCSASSSSNTITCKMLKAYADL